MKRSRKSNRVSWAPSSIMCQVKLFLSEDCPSKVGLKFQDHLQAKASPMLPSCTNEYNDLPPGFEDNHFQNQSMPDLSHIPQIKWESPPQITLSHHWCVAAGEESKEKFDQKLRELKVLEAYYPRLSAIPPSPSVSYDVEKENYDDNLTPLIPIIPIEEEDSISVDINPEVAVTKHLETPTNLQSLNLQKNISATSPISSQSNTTSSVPLSACWKPVPSSAGADPDLAAASALLAAAIMKNNEQGNPIDMDLLVKIFNDPAMVENLAHQRGAAAATKTASSNAMAILASGTKHASLSVPSSKLTHDEAVSRTTLTSTVGLVPASGPKQATPLSSLLMPTSNKPATPSVPFSRLASSSVALPTAPTTPSPPPPPPTTAAPHMHRPVNKNNTHHVSNGMLPSVDIQPPQQDTVMLSGTKRAAPLPAVSSNEFSTVPLYSAAAVNLHAMPHHQPSNGSTFAVKDANYYKNLIRQHGADGQDSLIGINHNNFQDLKPVHNNNFKQREEIYKNQKPCIYFKSSRGCRNGSNCPYQHDLVPQWGAGNGLLTQNAKRMKLGPEIKGRI